MNNNKTVFFAIGVLLVILGTFMLIPFFVQFIYDEKNNTFLSSASVTAFVGILLILTNLEENKKLNLQQAFLLTTLSWLSIAIFGCLPACFGPLKVWSRLIAASLESPPPTKAQPRPPMVMNARTAARIGSIGPTPPRPVLRPARAPDHSSGRGPRSADGRCRWSGDGRRSCRSRPRR